MTEPELRQAIPQVQTVARPAAGPGGTRGSWMLPGTLLAGRLFDTTFFFRNRRLERVEQLWSTSQPRCDAVATFEAVLNSLTSQWGPATVASDPGEAGSANQSASWVQAQTSVVLVSRESPGQCAVRLVHKPQNVKDASEL
jgi:hypothetical protein